MKKLLMIFSVFLLTVTCYSQVQITNNSIYHTDEQMFLANEINESGEPYAEDIGYNLDDLDPFVLNSPDSIAYTLGIENYEYSRYQLGTIISRSGMGLHMIWGPIIMQMAAMETDPNFDGSFTGSPNGYNEDDELIKNIMHFSMLANHLPPGNPWPQFAEFIDGDPRLPQPIDPINFQWNDFSSLRWNRNLMDKTLNPAAMGQALMKQYLWAQDMLGAFHDSLENEIVPDGIITPDSTGSNHFDPTNNVFYGGDNLDGFVGQVLVAEGANKTKFLINSLAYDGNSLGSVDPMTYDPANGIQFFPHKISITESLIDSTMPPQATSLIVSDASSHLWDQISFLWGTINFKNMSDPDNISDPAHLGYKSVFDGDPFPAPMSQTGMPGIFDLFKGTSKVIALNIFAMHFNATEGTLVDISDLVNGNVQQGNSISTFTAGYSAVILKQVSEEFNGTPLGTMATDVITAQANYIINNLYDGNGRFFNSYTIGSGADNSSTTVENQSAAVRGLLAAYELTSDNNFLTAAQNGYDYLISHFYIQNAKAFATTEGNNLAVYTPLKFAAISGALREARLVLNESEAPTIYTRFFKTIANKMQYSEGNNTGETGNDSDGDGVPYIPEQPDNLPPVFATEATLDLSGVNSVGDDETVPTEFVLEQNYPNPFNPTTTISFKLPNSAFVSLKVYNVLGAEVATLVNGNQTAGAHNINFNASNLASGIYLYRIEAGNFSAVKKLTLLK